jgi:predicted PurR-regulated permease PerM
MAFSLDQFYRINRRILIWLILFFLLWLLRDFFGVIFLTFVLSFIAAPLIRYAQRWLHLGRRVSIVAVYLFFLLTFTAFAMFVTPALGKEAKNLFKDMRGIEQRLVDAKARLMRDVPAFESVVLGYMQGSLPPAALGDSRLVTLEREMHEIQMRLGLDASDSREVEEIGPPPEATAASLATTDTITTTAVPAAIATSDQKSTATLSRAEHRELKVLHADLRAARNNLLFTLYLNTQTKQLAEKVPVFLQSMFNVLFTIAIALLFSFLISLDIPRLETLVKSLSASRLRDFYEQTAQPVVRFAYIVGRAIQAQALIAVSNTILTVIGLLLLQIPSVALLSVVVFVCSFIPVLGVFLSTTPILLFALNSGGFKLAIGSVVLVCVIHAIEAYVLNPLIYGKHLKINPVIVLIILFVGHHAFGIWGMILGVPVAHYFIHDVFGVPLWDERKLATVLPLSAMQRTGAGATPAPQDELAAHPESKP